MFSYFQVCIYMYTLLKYWKHCSKQLLLLLRSFIYGSQVLVDCKKYRLLSENKQTNLSKKGKYLSPVVQSSDPVHWLQTAQYKMIERASTQYLFYILTPVNLIQLTYGLLMFILKLKGLTILLCHPWTPCHH